MSVAVELRHITKRFPGVIANKDVSIKVETGTVHALVGENGAGKSTVMKILYGMQRPDSGEILVNGKEVHFKNPNDAIDAGIGMVHQHFMLADNFTVLENIILGSEPKHGATIDFAAARKKIVEMAAQYGLEIDPDVLDSWLTVKRDEEYLKSIGVDIQTLRAQTKREQLASDKRAFDLVDSFLRRVATAEVIKVDNQISATFKLQPVK